MFSAIFARAAFLMLVSVFVNLDSFAFLSLVVQLIAFRVPFLKDLLFVKNLLIIKNCKKNLAA